MKNTKSTTATAATANTDERNSEANINLRAEKQAIVIPEGTTGTALQTLKKENKLVDSQIVIDYMLSTSTTEWERAEMVKHMGKCIKYKPLIELRGKEKLLKSFISNIRFLESQGMDVPNEMYTKANDLTEEIKAAKEAYKASKKA